MTDKIKTTSSIYINSVQKARKSFLLKNALITRTIEFLTSFVLIAKIKRIRNHINIAISLVENMFDKLFISIILISKLGLQRYL